MNDLFPYFKDINSKKKAWLDYLYYKIGKQKYNYKICELNKDSDGNNKGKTWKTYMEAVAPLDIKEHWKLKNYNQRQILPNEVVLDLEDKKLMDKIIQELTERNLNFYIFDTHSRGIHINIFFNQKLSMKRKTILINFFGADSQKASENTMIALEFTPHWKSKQIKELIYYND